MRNNLKISNATVRRLPRYRRNLLELKKSNADKISSDEFSKIIGYTASQIRQDLSHFGYFGQQGYGYNIHNLYNGVNSILGLNQVYKIIIIGAGNLGQALARNTNFYKSEFKLQAMFDVNPKIIGLMIKDIKIYDYDVLDEYLKLNSIDIGIICTSKNNAQEVADKLCRGCVKGIWNFTPRDLTVEGDVVLENVHLSDSLYSLTYHINKNKQMNQEK